MKEEKEGGSSGVNVKRRGEEGVPEYAARTLELPLFDGSDPQGWVFEVERYFEFHHMDDTARMETIVLCMSGEALTWFRRVQRRKPPRSLDEFRRALIIRFQTVQDGSMYERFLALRQEGNVRDYIRQFQLLAAPLPDIPDCVLEAKFMNGLKTEDRADVRVFKPEGLVEIMETEKLVEDKNNIVLLNSPVRITMPQTMKLKGTLKERSVVVKIASGATHNFISQNLATELKLPLDYTSDYSVVLCSGKTIEGGGICRRVPLQIQKLSVVQDLLPLELWDGEVILGMQWLVTLGRTEVNWKCLTKKLKVGKETITLQGDPSLRNSSAILKGGQFSNIHSS